MGSLTTSPEAIIVAMLMLSGSARTVTEECLLWQFSLKAISVYPGVVVDGTAVGNLAAERLE
jgi:hypothetical protein